MIKIKSKIKNQLRRLWVGAPTETSEISKVKSGIAPLILIVVIGIVLAAGGLGLGLAWKAGLFGNPGGGPGDGTTTNGTQPQPPPSDGENGEEDPTRDWETYTNAKYGYSIRYPKDWQVETGNRGSDIRPPDMVALGGVQISVELATETDVKAFINAIIRRELDPEAFGATYESVDVGGLSGVKVSFMFGGEGLTLRETYVAVVRENYGYYLELFVEADPFTGQPTESGQSPLKVFEAMVGTFEFL